MDVTVVEADVLKPLAVRGPFNSAALHLVIHCLPGPLARKAAAVANVAAVLAPTGVLFGASVLGTSGRHTRAARGMLGASNRHGGFDNLGDTARAPAPLGHPAPQAVPPSPAELGLPLANPPVPMPTSDDPERAKRRHPS